MCAPYAEFSLLSGLRASGSSSSGGSSGSRLRRGFCCSAGTLTHTSNPTETMTTTKTRPARAARIHPAGAQGYARIRRCASTSTSARAVSRFGGSPGHRRPQSRDSALLTRSLAQPGVAALACRAYSQSQQPGRASGSDSDSEGRDGAGAGARAGDEPGETKTGTDMEDTPSSDRSSSSSSSGASPPPSSPLASALASLRTRSSALATSLRSTLDAYRSSLSPRLHSSLSRANAQWNAYSGYSSIEAAKSRVSLSEARLAALRSSCHDAQVAYTSAVEARSRSQKELNDLLARKGSWSDEDLAAYTRLLRDEHAQHRSEEEARKRFEDAERDVSQAWDDVVRTTLERYHEEQVWSDRVRYVGSHTQVAVVVLNLLVFTLAILLVEPYKRRALAQTLEERLLAGEDAGRRALEGALRRIEERLEGGGLGAGGAKEGGEAQRMEREPEVAREQEGMLGVTQGKEEDTAELPPSQLAPQPLPSPETESETGASPAPPPAAPGPAPPSTESHPQPQPQPPPSQRSSLSPSALYSSASRRLSAGWHALSRATSSAEAGKWAWLDPRVYARALRGAVGGGGGGRQTQVDVDVQEQEQESTKAPAPAPAPASAPAPALAADQAIEGQAQPQGQGQPADAALLFSEGLGLGALLGGAVVWVLLGGGGAGAGAGGA